MSGKKFTQDPKTARLAEASRMLAEGRRKTEIAQELNVAERTVHTWITQGKIGAHLADVPNPKPRPGPGRPRKNENLHLPPLKIAKGEISASVEAVKKEGLFAAQAADGYKGLWFVIKKHVDHILAHTEAETLDPLKIKSLIETLQKLSAHVEAYEEANRGSEVGADQLSVMRELQERRARLTSLYQDKAEGE